MAASAGDDKEAWGGDEGVPGGDREWHFRDGTLTVRAYEDFVAGAIGGVVTAASIQLSRFVAEEAPEGTWCGRLCVELGSGCGLVSGTLVQLGARVVATEQEAFLEHLQWNLQLNAPPSAGEEVARCETLDWDSSESRGRLRAAIGEAGADFVVGANCIYATQAVAPFLSGIEAVFGPKTVAFVCGVPKPSAEPKEHTWEPGLARGQTILDAFLAAAPATFDCYLVGTAGHSVAIATDAATVTLEPGHASQDEGEPTHGDPNRATGAATAIDGRGVAEIVSERHGIPVGVLADAVWLLVSRGTTPPAWVRPLLRL